MISVSSGRWSTPRWTGTSGARSSRYCTSSAVRWTTWCAKSSTIRSTATRNRNTPRTIASYRARPTSCHVTLHPRDLLQTTREQTPQPRPPQQTNRPRRHPSRFSSARERYSGGLTSGRKIKAASLNRIYVLALDSRVRGHDLHGFWRVCWPCVVSLRAPKNVTPQANNVCGPPSGGPTRGGDPGVALIQHE